MTTVNVLHKPTKNLQFDTIHQEQQQRQQQEKNRCTYMVSELP